MWNMPVHLVDRFAGTLTGADGSDQGSFTIGSVRTELSCSMQARTHCTISG